MMESMTGKQTGTHVYDAKLDASSDLQSFFESDNLVVATRFFRNPPLIADLEDRLAGFFSLGRLNLYMVFHHHSKSNISRALLRTRRNRRLKTDERG